MGDQVWAEQQTGKRRGLLSPQPWLTFPRRPQARETLHGSCGLFKSNRRETGIHLGRVDSIRFWCSRCACVCVYARVCMHLSVCLCAWVYAREYVPVCMQVHVRT